MEKFFKNDSRLGIPVPDLDREWEWEAYPAEVQDRILLHWENIRGSIPDRIVDLEKIINKKQSQLEDEQDFKKSCCLKSEITELASVINELWLWYRTSQDVTGKIHL
ncbi:hypothetical protein [Mesobacillus zeae]|uniref:hypothetical protein n=1 Tax=Mesobacillus zeae TaxID=1917180 RepID=UPI00300AD881